jgi:hypothetical protein
MVSFKDETYMDQIKKIPLRNSCCNIKEISPIKYLHIVKDAATIHAETHSFIDGRIRNLSIFTRVQVPYSHFASLPKR